LTLIGNDVVDLIEKENIAKHKDRRFIDRIFTLNEKTNIFNYSCPNTMLWALWAGKEAAYKVEKKLSPEVHFVPRAYAVGLSEHPWGKSKLPIMGECFAGKVKTPKRYIDIEILATSDFIHCLGVVKTAKSSSVDWGIDNIYQNPRLTDDCALNIARKVAGEKLAAHLNCDSKRIEIRREQKVNDLGPPLVYFDGKVAEIDISLSHDGRFVAYAFANFNFKN